MSRSVLAVLSFLLIATFAHVCSAQSTSSTDKTVSVSPDDAEMNAAIANARSTLPKFWVQLAKPIDGEDYFALKLRLTDGLHVEHFWCDQIVGGKNSATCVIGNDPNSVTTVKIGQRIAIENDKIFDWMIRKYGKISGGETIRVLLPKMGKAEADALRAALVVQ